MAISAQMKHLGSCLLPRRSDKQLVQERECCGTHRVGPGATEQRSWLALLLAVNGVPKDTMTVPIVSASARNQVS